MATVKKIPVLPVPPPPAYEITLTEKEAEALAGLLYNGINGQTIEDLGLGNLADLLCKNDAHTHAYYGKFSSLATLRKNI